RAIRRRRDPAVGADRQRLLSCRGLLRRDQDAQPQAGRCGRDLLTSFTRIVLIFERRPHESRLMQDVVVGVIYLGATLSVLAYVFSVPVGTLIATSGVFAIILGLALQSTLADVFSGVALNLSRAYKVGDWIVLSDGAQGRVVETNWRGTSLLNSA